MNVPRSAGRPSAGTKTARVWEIAETLSHQLGRPPRVSEVVRSYVTEGGHPGTGQVQYYAWKAARGRDAEGLVGPQPPQGPDRLGDAKAWLSIASDGSVVIPFEFRQAMRLNESGKVRAEIIDGELRLLSAQSAVERVQRLVRQFDKGEGSMVDELIRDRRVEAERE